MHERAEEKEGEGGSEEADEPGPEGPKKREREPIWRHFNRLSSDHVITPAITRL